MPKRKPQKKTEIQINNNILPEEIEYVIYCRKSTEENSWRQNQSIPDQIKLCVEYAKINWLKIKVKDKDYDPIFETVDEINKEDSEADIGNNRQYKTTRNLFIIKEQTSAKIPWNRPKWTKLMSLIKSWKIKWLLSYSPDRQARNIMEGGELINYVDIGLVDLRYTSFHFENSSSGKMMLWIWFVFSKQYSDKLWDDVNRWNRSKVEAGKAMWVYKHWYIINKDGYHKPHPQYFDLWRFAFEMKLEGKKSDKYITERLISNGYRKEHRWEESNFNGKNIYQIWTDTFYYWQHIHGKHETDLRESSTFYVPMITEDEHQVLIERYYSNSIVKAPKERKEENYDIMPFEENIIKSEDGFSMSFYLPNKKRFYEKLKSTKKDITLADVVQSKQIRYRCVNTNSKFRNLELTYDKLEAEVLHLLKNTTISDEGYKMCVERMQERAESEETKAKAEIKKVRFDLNKTEWLKAEYIRKHMGMKKDEMEEKIYEAEKKRYDNIVFNMKQKIDSLESIWRNKLLEFESTLKIVQNSHKYYKNGNYVQRRKIAKILISNIHINAKKQIHINVSPIFRQILHLNQGWQELNPRREALETSALPLSYTPICK